MKNFKSIFLALFACIITASVTGQAINPEVFFTQGASFPEDMLKTKAAVMLSGTLGIEEGKKIQVAAQEQFQRAGIDAVAYYDILDVYSGNDTENAFAALLKKRGVGVAIIIHKSPSEYTAYITALGQGTNLFSMGQQAWTLSDADYKRLFSNIYRRASNAGLERINLLINDVPEPGQLPKIVTSRRFETYNPNLTIDLLAVPNYYKSPGDSAVAAAIMNNYPYKFEYVNPDLTDRDLLDQKFQFRLCRIQTRGSSILRMLDYKGQGDQKELMSIGINESRKMPIGRPVYKYYIKHLFTGNIYVGEKWDADPDWSKAFENYIQHSVNAIKK